MQIQGTYKEIRQIAIPIIIGSFAQSINQLIDTAFVSRLGEAPLGGATLSGMMYYMYCMVFFGFTRGGQILIARAAGQKNDKLTGKIFGQMWVMAAVLLLFNIVVLLIGNQLFIELFIDSDAIKPYAHEFMKYRAFGLPLVLISANMQAFFTGLGDTKIITVSTVLMAATNILLDWAMIFGNLGFEPMGVAGAALATSISEGVWAAIFVFYYFYKKYYLNYSISKKSLLPDSSLLQQNFTISMPLVGQNFIALGSWFFFFQALEKYGERALAISSILKGLYVFILVPGWGFATTANTMISNIFGQNRKDDILPTMRKLMLVSGSVGTFICVMIGVFPHQVLSLFTDNEQLISETYISLYIVLIALIMFSISCVYFQMIAAVGATTMSMYFELAAVITYSAYIYVVMYVYKMPMHIAWLSELVYWFTIIFLGGLYIKSGKWRNLPTNIDTDEKVV